MYFYNIIIQIIVENEIEKWLIQYLFKKKKNLIKFLSSTPSHQRFFNDPTTRNIFKIRRKYFKIKLIRNIGNIIFE